MDIFSFKKKKQQAYQKQQESIIKDLILGFINGEASVDTVPHHNWGKTPGDQGFQNFENICYEIAVPVSKKLRDTKLGSAKKSSEVLSDNIGSNSKFLKPLNDIFPEYCEKCYWRVESIFEENKELQLYKLIVELPKGEYEEYCRSRGGAFKGAVLKGTALEESLRKLLSLKNRPIILEVLQRKEASLELIIDDIKALISAEKIIINPFIIKNLETLLQESKKSVVYKETPLTSKDIEKVQKLITDVMRLYQTNFLKQEKTSLYTDLQSSFEKLVVDHPHKRVLQKVKDDIKISDLSAVRHQPKRTPRQSLIIKELYNSNNSEMTEKSR